MEERTSWDQISKFNQLFILEGILLMLPQTNLELFIYYFLLVLVVFIHLNDSIVYV